MRAVERRRVALGLATAGLLVVAASGPASAGLPVPLPVAPSLPVSLPVAVPLPGPGGVVDGATGTVGGIVGGVQDQITGSVDQAVGGVLQGGRGALPANTVETLLQVLVTPGAAGAGDALPVGDAVADTVAPTAHVTVLSRLRQIAKTGSLRLLVSSNEPGVVAVAGSTRPGVALKGRGKGHSRKAVRWPAAVLAFRNPGKLQLTVKVSRSARISLGRSRNARLGVGTIAADVHKNQRTDYVVRQIRR